MSQYVKEKWGFHGHSTIDHDFHLKTINDDKVVIDHATGLMWHQSGSDKYLSWKRAKKWIEDLNKKRLCRVSRLEIAHCRGSSVIIRIGQEEWQPAYRPCI